VGTTELLIKEGKKVLERVIGRLIVAKPLKNFHTL
jgi:hypothetical protein